MGCGQSTSKPEASVADTATSPAGTVNIAAHKHHHHNSAQHHQQHHHHHQQPPQLQQVQAAAVAAGLHNSRTGRNTTTAAAEQIPTNEEEAVRTVLSCFIVDFSLLLHLTFPSLLCLHKNK